MFCSEDFLVNKLGRREYPASTLHVYFTDAGLFQTELKSCKFLLQPHSSTPDLHTFTGAIHFHDTLIRPSVQPSS